MPKVFIFSDADIGILKTVIQGERTRVRNNHNHRRDEIVHPAQDVYIAKLPDGPGVVLAGMNMTTLVPGTADCKIYKLDQDDDEISAITNPDASNFEVKVYNFFSNPFFHFSKYIRIMREKGGAWVCDKPPTHYRATLDGNLVQGGSATASIFYRNSTNTAWVDSDSNVTAREFSLNLDEMYVQYQKGWVEWDEGGVWVFDSTACPVADDTGLVP